MTCECCVPRKWPDLGKALPASFHAPAWRSVRKAASGDAEDAGWLLAIADALLPAARAAFLLAVERLRGSASEEKLRVAIETGRIDEVMRVLDIEGQMKTALQGTLAKPLEDAFIEAGREAPARTLGNVEGALSMRFDLANPHSLRFLQDYDFGMIRQVSQETRMAVRRVVSDAFLNGGHPYAQAKKIKSFIGLTDRQAQAGINYRAALEEEGRPADQVERMSEKFNAKLLRRRAESVARTETVRAANAGQQSAWSSAADKGLLNRATFRQGWLVTPDDRLCFPATTPVMTMDGWKPISKIKAGDMVLTHEDRFRMVEGTIGRHHNGEVVQIKFPAARIKATATVGHELLTRRGWVPIEQITLDDEVRILARPCVGCGELRPHGPGEHPSRCATCTRAANNVARWSRPGEREKLTAANNKRWSDPAQRKRASEISKGRVASPETRAKIRDAALWRFMDPERHAKQTAHNRRTAKNPDHPFNKITPERRTTIIKNAMKARAKKNYGGSYLERKVRWFLEKQGIEYEQQWYFTYGETQRRGFADFYLPGPRVVIECDGPHHLEAEQQARDAEKDAAIAAMGIEVVRFDAHQIRAEFGKVADAITGRCCFMWMKPKSTKRYGVKRQPVYDIQVAEDHSFVAAGIVAHNCIFCAAVPLMNPEGIPLGGLFKTPLGPVDAAPLHPQCRCTVYPISF